MKDRRDPPAKDDKPGAPRRAPSRRRRTDPAVRAQMTTLHDLHVYQEELVVQNQQLASAQQLLEETRDRFVDLYEFAPIGYLTLDENGIVLQINLTGASMLGRSKHRVEGLPLIGLFTGKSRTEFLDLLRRSREATLGTPLRSEIRISAGGPPRDIEFFCRSRESRATPPREYFTAMVDVTERKLHEQEHATAAREHAALASRLLSVQDEERHRIARDLHDDVGQQLTVLKLKLELVAASLPAGAAKQQLEDARGILAALDHRLHFMAADLRPSVLDLGLAAALREFISQWSATFGVAAEFEAPGLERARMAPDVETHLYRVVQEALHNIYRHAEATHASVLLERRSDGLVLIVEDNGRGFVLDDARNAAKGLGLVGMRERANLVGARIEIESAPGRGTSIFLHFSGTSNSRHVAGLHKP